MNQKRRIDMKKLFALMRRAPKRTSAVFAMIAAAVIVPLALNAWGPNRATFTMKNPAPYVTFNSITDNPDYGDERNFVRIKDAANTSAGGWSDEINVQPGKEYLVQMYVHNNAADNLNLVAKNVNAKFNVPATTGKRVQIDGFITSSNAKPQQVWDQAIFNSDKNFNIAYVPGSAIYYNNKTGKSGVKLSDAIVTNSGAKLGYELPLNGDIPGCFKYSGYVSFKVKAQVQETLNFDVDKTVRKSGTTDFKENVKVNPGDKVDFQIHFKNTGESTLNKVVIRDMLPAGMTYVPGTTWLHNGNGTRQVADGITASGLQIGNYGKGGGAYLKFTAQLAANDALPKCGTNTLKNVARATTEGYQKDDDATVTVDKYCAPVPKYTCDSLTVKKLDRTKFEFSTNYTVQNATFKNVIYVVRNAAGAEVYRGTNATYTQTTPGSYSVQAIVTVTVNGQDQTATSDNCKKSFIVEKEKVPGVSIDKKVDGKEHADVAVGEEFTYQLVVKNTGDIDLKNVKVTDKAPANVEFVRADKGMIVKADRGFPSSTDSWSYTIPELKVGQSISINITAKITNYVEDRIINTACVDAPETPKNPDDCDDATVKPKKPGVSIDKKVDGVEHKKVNVNQEFVYQLVITNTGESTLTNVAVMDNAPAHVQFIRADKGTITDNKWSYTIPSLAPGKSVTVAITAKVTKEVSGVITNTACVDAPQVPGIPDDCDDATVEVPPKPEVPVIEVCGLDSKKIITIKQSDFDSSKHSKNLNDCKTPDVPTELPTTGVSEGVMAMIGLGSLVASLGYYIASRRALGA